MLQNRIPTDTPRQIDVDSMLILRRYVEKKISMNFHIMSTYFFNVISMGKKLTLFRRSFIDESLMGEKSTPFRLTFFDLISLDVTSTLF